MNHLARPEPVPGPFVSPRVASELTDVPPDALADLMRRGLIGTVRIQGKAHVDLSDVDRHAGKWGGS